MLKITHKNTAENQQISTRPIMIHSYVAMFGGGFDLRFGGNLGKERNGATQILQYIAPTENNGFAQLYAYDPKHTSHKLSVEDKYLNMEFIHSIDYLAVNPTNKPGPNPLPILAATLLPTVNEPSTFRFTPESAVQLPKAGTADTTNVDPQATRNT